TNRNRQFSCGSNWKPSPWEHVRQETTHQISKRSNKEGDPGILANGRQIKFVNLFEVFRKPENVKVPCWIQEDLRDCKSPHEACSKERTNRWWMADFHGCIGRSVVSREPGNQPQYPEHANAKKGRLPTQFENYERDYGRRQNRTNR